MTDVLLSAIGGLWASGSAALLAWCQARRPAKSGPVVTKPADLQAGWQGDQLTLWNFGDGPAASIVVLLDGEPWDRCIERLGGGYQFSAPARKAASVVVRWVDGDGTEREWSNEGSH